MDDKAYRYAGLQRVFTPGLSVAEAVERLRRCAYVEQRLMRLLASRIVSIPQRDIKILLARLQYEDAVHADGCRARVGEMRTNKSKLEGTPDAALEILFDEAEYLPGAYPFLAAVTHVLKPALCAAYNAYLEATNDLADYASVRLGSTPTGCLRTAVSYSSYACSRYDHIPCMGLCSPATGGGAGTSRLYDGPASE